MSCPLRPNPISSQNSLGIFKIDAPVDIHGDAQLVQHSDDSEQALAGKLSRKANRDFLR